MTAPRSHQLSGSVGISELLDRLYGAALDPLLWPGFLQAFNDRVRGSVAALHWQDHSGNRGSAAVVHGLEPEWHRRYEQHYGHVNPWLLAHRAAPALGDFNDSEALVPSNELKRSEFYNDFLAPQDLRYSLGVVVHRTASTSVTLTTLRGELMAPYGAEERGLYQLLVPHLVRALSIQSLLAMQGSTIERCKQTLDHWACGVLHLDSEGRVLWMNRRAHAMVDSGHRMALTIGGQLILRNAVSGKLLAKALRQWRIARQPSLAPAPVGIPIAGEPGEPAWDGMLMHIESNRTLARESDAVHALFIADPQFRPAAFRELLASHFALTPKEAVVAEKLSMGLSMSAIAEQLDVSRETIRSHVKALFQKTDCRRQADLVLKFQSSLAGTLDPVPA